MSVIAVCNEKDQHLPDIRMGEELNVSYEIENHGTEDLVIERVSTSCGCTAPLVPKDSIKPGEKGTVVLRFNSNGRIGLNTKSAAVVGNFETPITLTFKVNVI